MKEINHHSRKYRRKDNTEERMTLRRENELKIKKIILK
jgi:hypothetical protein